MRWNETDWSLKIKNAENEGFKVISKLDEEGPGPAQHDGPRQVELPKIKLGSGAGEEEGSVKHRDTHTTWQPEVAKPFKFKSKSQNF